MKKINFNKIKNIIPQKIKIAVIGLILSIVLSSFNNMNKVEYKYNAIANYYIKNRIQFSQGVWMKLNKTQNVFVLGNDGDMDKDTSDTFSYQFKNGDIFIDGIKQYSSQIGDSCECLDDFGYAGQELSYNQCVVTNYVENYDYMGIKTSYYELKLNVHLSHYARIRIAFDNKNEIPVFSEHELFRNGGNLEMRLLYYLVL